MQFLRVSTLGKFITQPVLTDRIISPFMQFASGESEPITVVQGMDGAGMGRVTSLKPGVSVEQAVKMVKEHLGLKFGTFDQRHSLMTVQLATPDSSASVSRVAVCAGSGEYLDSRSSSLISQGGSVFKDVEADLLVTGEMSHVSSKIQTIIMSSMKYWLLSPRALP